MLRSLMATVKDTKPGARWSNRYSPFVDRPNIARKSGGIHIHGCLWSAGNNRCRPILLTAGENECSPVDRKGKRHGTFTEDKRIIGESTSGSRL